MASAKAHRDAAQALQTEFDKAYVDANALVTDILGKEVLDKLSAHRNHTVDILIVYNPVFESLDDIPIGDCSNTVIGMLQTSISGSGSRASICSRNYHRDVSKASSDITGPIKGLSDEYIKLSTFVYHSFAGNNALVDGQKIEQIINSTYLELVDKLKFEPVDTDAFKATLASIGKNFQGCLDDAKIFASNGIQTAAEQVDICKEIHDIPRASRGLRAVEFVSLLPQFEEFVNNYKPYQWD